MDDTAPKTTSTSDGLPVSVTPSQDNGNANAAATTTTTTPAAPAASALAGGGAGDAKKPSESLPCDDARRGPRGAARSPAPVMVQAAVQTSGKQRVATVGIKKLLDSTNPGDAPGEEPRETWGKKADFLLSVIGFAVDLSNVWRFPYLCYKYGGGAFLVPYCIMLAVGGIPLFFMELALGQYHRKGAITCWGRLVPLFKGVGYTVVLIALYVDFYYNVIIAWALHYFVISFMALTAGGGDLPWTKCDHHWNTPNCSSAARSGHEGHTSPADEYFKHELFHLGGTIGLDNLGVVKWDNAVYLLAVYIICYFSLWKGISTSGKVVWFTALFPYVVLFILLIRGITLPGAYDGIRYYLTPKYSVLGSSEVWVDAATQVFFSLGPGFGVLLAFSSYNKFHNNVLRDAVLTSAINSATSFLAGFVIFSVLGFMAHRANVEISKVATEGPGLVFAVYPEAIAAMPGSPAFFSVMFFLMLLTIGLDSSFGGSEAVITGIGDEFPIMKRHRELFVAGLFLFYYIIGLLSCTEGGVYVVYLLDQFAATYSILIAVFFEAVAVSWIYGIRRFSEDIREMLGRDVGIYWRFCWMFVAPIFILIIVVSSFAGYSGIDGKGDYNYPGWAETVGFLLAGSSVLCIPICAIKGLLTAKGSLRERLRELTTPWRDRQAPQYQQQQQQQQLLQPVQHRPLETTGNCAMPGTAETANTNAVTPTSMGNNSRQQPVSTCNKNAIRTTTFASCGDFSPRAAQV